MKTFSKKKERLTEIIDRHKDKNIIVAFSGGVDSSVLLKTVANQLLPQDKQVHAVTFHATLHPARELTEAKTTAAGITPYHHIIQIDELQFAGIMDNPENRCYLCKKYLFEKLLKKADELGVSAIMEGTNCDDLYTHRPGIKALRDLNILSPLAEAGLTKNEIRKLAEEYTLPTANKPATPCLATRFPYGTKLSAEKLTQVAEAEAFVQSFGFTNVRVRVYENIARLELDIDELSKIIALKDKITSGLKEIGYHYITVDLEGFRSGSMDTTIIPPNPRSENNKSQ